MNLLRGILQQGGSDKHGLRLWTLFEAGNGLRGSPDLYVSVEQLLRPILKGIRRSAPVPNRLLL
jgi:hypothetical protein